MAYSGLTRGPPAGCLPVQPDMEVWGEPHTLWGGGLPWPRVPQLNASLHSQTWRCAGASLGLGSHSLGLPFLREPRGMLPCHPMVLEPSCPDTLERVRGLLIISPWQGSPRLGDPGPGQGKFSDVQGFPCTPTPSCTGRHLVLENPSSLPPAAASEPSTPAA